MQQFRKKPVVIEAVQVTLRNALDVFHWIGETAEWPIGVVHPVIIIRTLEGDMDVGMGDWVIKGVAGEFYPCKDEIFRQTYEAVD